ncbi:MAG: hypothetical protein M1434_01420 [Chloroflexi bacterium]|nr:hypothetical protein [Chloroflexota bacterium]MCL5273391.1 hypothetical protein [Chloroflexota bacterium]
MADADIFIDSETLDSLHDTHIARLPPKERVRALRFGLAATYDDTFGWRTWTSSLAHLLWNNLSMPGLRVVGWDILEYDLPVLSAATQHEEPLSTLDLCAEILAATGRRYHLDTVARANLGRGKVLDTYQVIEWLRKGDPASMEQATQHCRNCAQLVMDLFALIKRGQTLMLPGRLSPGSYSKPMSAEDHLRVLFALDGRWQRCEDSQGRVIAQQA